MARLIEKELRDPSLPKLVEEHEQLKRVVLVWHRDYWRATGRPRIEEKIIMRTPLGELGRSAWVDSLEEARTCLDPRRRRRGRATQVVTLPSGRQVEGEVSPHLIFRYVAPARMEWEALCREGEEVMQPLYDWAVRRSRQPIRF